MGNWWEGPEKGVYGICMKGCVHAVFLRMCICLHAQNSPCCQLVTGTDTQRSLSLQAGMGEGGNYSWGLVGQEEGKRLLFILKPSAFS